MAMAMAGNNQRLDTHAMAYRLLMETWDEEGKEETGSVKGRISEHGKEARMDFYTNRSRSEGASAFLVASLRDLKHQMEENRYIDDTHTPREISSGRETPGRDGIRQDPSSKFLNGYPTMYIPSSDSCEQLFIFQPNVYNSAGKKRFIEDRFVPYFTLPSSNYILHCLVDQRRICLESFNSDNAHLSFTLLLKPTSTSSRVYVRRTLDDWKSNEDIDGAFMETVEDRPSVQRYSVQMAFPNGLKSGVRLEVALAYEVRLADGDISTYWDNNNEANYTFWYSG